MTSLIPIVMYSWPLVVLALFSVLPPRRAVIAAFLFAWMFLPMATYHFQGLPSYGKMEATSYGALLGVLLFDAGRFSTLRFRWIDLPLAVWLMVPMASSVTNGLGAYDGLSSMFTSVVTWGIPYLMGRLYVSDLEGLRELAVGIFIGGLIYMPFVLYEIRMSPRLHLIVYGFRQHSWRQTMRFDGWRPMVFMQHGLALSMWMTTASLAGFWLWWSGAMKRLWNVPMSYLVAAMFVTTVLCKSAGALVLLALGTGVLYVTRRLRTGWLILTLALLPILYMGVRASGIWDGSHLIRAVQTIVPERLGSLEYRLRAEDILAEHALRQPVFGWGAWSRNRPSSMGYAVSDLATDGLWIITFGQRGLVGLAALTSVILLPAILLCLRVRSRQAWSDPHLAGPMVLAVILSLFMIDSLFNAMLNPIYIMAAAGLGTWVISLGRTSTARLTLPAVHSQPVRPMVVHRALPGES